MAFVIEKYSASQTDTILTSGVPGKRIVLLRFMMYAAGAGTVSFGSETAEGADELIFGDIRVTSDQQVDIVLGRQYAVSTEVGAGLSFTSDFGPFEVDHDVFVWYEEAP